MLLIICTKYGKNPSWTVDATWRTRKVNGQTDRQTDRRTDRVNPIYRISFKLTDIHFGPAIVCVCFHLHCGHCTGRMNRVPYTGNVYLVHRYGQRDRVCKLQLGCNGYSTNAEKVRCGWDIWYLPFLHDRPWISPLIKSISNELDITCHVFASQLSSHCDVIADPLWRHQQNVMRATETRGIVWRSSF